MEKDEKRDGGEEIRRTNENENYGAKEKKSIKQRKWKEWSRVKPKSNVYNNTGWAERICVKRLKEKSENHSFLFYSSSSFVYNSVNNSPAPPFYSTTPPASLAGTIPLAWSNDEFE